MNDTSRHDRGVPIAVGSAILLGLTPVLGKQAITAGMSSLAVVAIRTAGAASLLLLVILMVRRSYLNIFPLGFLGCLIAGILNGIGSILYYSGLALVDASLGQLLYGLYPIFVAFFLFLDGLKHTRLTILSLVISVPAIALLTQATATRIAPLGIVFMIGSSFLYAIHIPINQRVLYEVPAPTVTLYTLFAMTAIVVPVYWIFSPTLPVIPEPSIAPLFGLTIVTFLSRLTLFAGVKSIGGMRASLLGLTELLVTVGLAHIWLGESLSLAQWAGAILLAIAMVMAGYDRPRATPPRTSGWLRWLSPRVTPSHLTRAQAWTED